MSIRQWLVLVVEDESDSMEMVRGVLEHYGIASVGVSSAEEALRWLRTETPTMIITDLALPGIDGWQFLAQVNTMAHLRHIPRIAITAYHTPEVAVQAIEYGFDAYFSKPLDTTSFVRELEGITRS
jgi:CheY-like chemotaxis protein